MSQFEGIIHVTGEHGTGKTLFALQCGAEVGKTCLFDDDVKGRKIARSVRESGSTFGAYHDLVEIAKGKTELPYFKEVRKIIDSIKPDQFDCIIWDTWTHFSSLCHAYVKANEPEFKSNWINLPEIRRGQQWQEARRFEASLISQMLDTTKTVILINHLKKHRINGVEVPGKFESNHSPVVQRVPNLSLWLRINPNSSVPIGLVLKRISKEIVENGRLRSINILPRKVTPHPEHESLWDTINYYIENPIGNRPPTPEESPTKFEFSILEGTLTEEQKHTFNEILRMGIQKGEEEESIASSLNQDELIGQVKALLLLKKPIPIIAKELDITISDVKKLIPSIPEVNF